MTRFNPGWDRSNTRGVWTERKCRTCGHWKNIRFFRREKGERARDCRVCIRQREYRAAARDARGWE